MKRLRIATFLSAALGFGLVASQALAQAYPNKPIKAIVPFAAGSATDQIGRAFTQKMSEVLGQPILYENRAGGGGLIAGETVAKSPADGYTLLQQGEGLTLNGILFDRLPYDGQKAFTPVIKAVVNPQILVVNPKTGIADFRAYLARAKARPHSISLGLPGNGGIAHVAHEMIGQETGDGRLLAGEFRFENSAVGAPFDLILQNSAQVRVTRLAASLGDGYAAHSRVCQAAGPVFGTFGPKLVWPLASATRVSRPMPLGDSS
jgi:hypothetical protein